MPSPWTYDDASKRYRDTRTGRYLSVKQTVALRDQYADAVKVRADALVDRLTKGDITLQQWVLQARQDVKTAYLDQYMLGRGGRNMMTQRDYGIIGAELKKQYQFLQNFGQDLAAGKMSEAQAKARFRLYMESSSQSFERAKLESRGMPRLSQIPADGQQQCKSNCRCSLHIEETETEWHVYWRRSAKESCPDCIRLSGEWNPLVVPKA